MEKKSFAVRSILMVLIMVFFVCIFYGIYMFLTFVPGIGKTSTAVASVQFDLEKYNFSLNKEDFKKIYLLENLECKRCDFSKDGKMILSEMVRGDNIRLTLYKGEGSILGIYFFGDKKSYVKSEVKKFLEHLRKTETFNRGYELYDPKTSTYIPKANEESWLNEP